MEENRVGQQYNFCGAQPMNPLYSPPQLETLKKWRTAAIELFNQERSIMSDSEMRDTLEQFMVAFGSLNKDEDVFLKAVGFLGKLGLVTLLCQEE